MDAATYLIGYLIFSTSVVILARVMARSGVDLQRAPAQVPAKPDGYALAWLENAEPAMLRLAGVELVRHGAVLGGGRALNLGGVAGPLTPVAEAVRRSVPLHCSERELLGCTRAPRVVEAMDTVVATLVADGLAVSVAARNQARLILVVACLMLGCIAAWRILTSLLNGHTNVEFAFLLALVAIVALVSAVPLPRITPAGQHLLNAMRRGYALTEVRSEAAQPAPATGYDPLLPMIGCMGVGALAGSALGDFPTAFPPAPMDSGGSSGGGSSDSGSSCGSSDGGGSGCGGGGD